MLFLSFDTPVAAGGHNEKMFFVIVAEFFVKRSKSEWEKMKNI